MARHHRKPVKQYEDAYPSLPEHRDRAGTTRRGFLATGAAVAGASALVTGCPGFFPGQVDGDIAEPSWTRVRFPAEPDDRAVYLIDGGYARFYAVGLTWTEDVALFALDNLAPLTDTLASVLSECTYDELSSSVDLEAVTLRMQDALNQAYEEDTGEIPSDWFYAVELYLTRLDAPVALDGAAGGDPAYP